MERMKSEGATEVTPSLRAAIQFISVHFIATARVSRPLWAICISLSANFALGGSYAPIGGQGNHRADGFSTEYQQGGGCRRC